MTLTPPPATVLLMLEVSKPDGSVARFFIEQGLRLALTDGTLTITDAAGAAVLTRTDVRGYRLGDQPAAEVILAPATTADLAAKGKALGKPDK